jgi:hypothetical protein
MNNKKISNYSDGIILSAKLCYDDPTPSSPQEGREYVYILIYCWLRQQYINPLSFKVY